MEEYKECFLLVNEIITKDPFIISISCNYNNYKEKIKNQLRELNNKYPELYDPFEDYKLGKSKIMEKSIFLDLGNKIYEFPKNIGKNESYLVGSVNKNGQLPYLIYIYCSDYDRCLKKYEKYKLNKLCDKYRNEITWNGYELDVAKSSIQKYIRRGFLHKALYFAGELDLFKEAENRGEIIRTNFLHRILVIYLEDVENISILEKINELINSIFIERTIKNRDKCKEEEMICNIINLLTTSKKARVCSHIRAVFNHKYNNKILLDKYPSIKLLWDDIDDNQKNKLDKYNLFKKYLKEKNILSVYYAFQIDISEDKIGRKKAVWFIFEQLKLLGSKINIFIYWYKNYIGKMKEGFMCWLFPLLYYLDIIKEDKYEKNDKNDKDEKVFYNWERNRNMEKIEIDNYVIDRHTKKGNNKSLVDFALTGAYVENEYDFVNKLWKSFYEDGKRFEENIDIIGETKNDYENKKVKKNINDNDLETSEYKFIVLTQITTSSSKMDVYFAKNKENKLVVVKGPYKSKKDIEIFLRNMIWKKENNIKYIPFIIRELIPDRWENGIPLGTRNKIDRNKKCFFIVFDSLIVDSQIIKKIHSSKIWPKTEVVDWSKINLHLNFNDNFTCEEIKDYLQSLLFRYIRGISDLADRNFLRKDSSIISIDEDIEDKDLNIYNELKKNKANIVYKWMNKYYNELSLDKWKNIYEDPKFEKIMDKNYCLSILLS